MTAVPPRPAAPDRGAWVCERCGNAPEQHAAGRVAQACIYAPGFDGSLRPAAPDATAGDGLTAEDLIRAARAMDTAGVPADASPEAVTAVALVLRDVLAAAARDAELREAVTSLAVRFETLSESLFSAASINAYDAAAECLHRALDGTP